MRQLLATGRRARTIATVLALALVSLQASYLLGANVLLSTSAFRGAIGGDPSKFLVRYRSAYSLLPGVVHVEDIHIRAQDTHTQWTLDLEEARFRVSLWDLLRRKATLSGVGGKGVVFRLRIKGDPLDVMPVRAGLLPPIHGFSDPPLRDTAPPLPDPPEDEVWMVHLADVNARVKELWVQEVRVVGEGRLISKDLTGLSASSTDGFLLKLGGHDFALGPSTFAIRKGTILLGPDAITRGLSGRVNLSVDRFDLGEDKDLRTLRYFSGHAHLKGSITGVTAFNYYLRERPELRLLGGEGDFDANLFLDHGVMTPASRMRSRADELAFAIGALVVRADLQTQLAFEDRSVAVQSIRLSRVRLAPRASPGPPLWSDRVDITARSKRASLAEGFPDSSVAVAMPLARAPDAAIFAPVLPGWLRVDAGELRVEALQARLSNTDQPGSASVRVELNHVVYPLGGQRARGNLRAELHADALDIDARTARGTGFVALQEVRWGDARGAPLSGRVDARAVVIDRRGITSPVTIGLQEADRLADELFNRIDLKLPEFVTDWLDHRVVRGSATLTARPPVFAVQDADLRGDNYRVRGRLRLSDGPTQARVLVESGPLAVGVGAVRGETEIVLFGSTSWFFSEPAPGTEVTDARLIRSAQERR